MGPSSRRTSSPRGQKPGRGRRLEEGLRQVTNNRTRLNSVIKHADCCPHFLVRKDQTRRIFPSVTGGASRKSADLRSWPGEATFVVFFFFFFRDPASDCVRSLRGSARFCRRFAASTKEVITHGTRRRSAETAVQGWTGGVPWRHASVVGFPCGSADGITDEYTRTGMVDRGSQKESLGGGNPRSRLPTIRLRGTHVN